MSFANGYFLIGLAGAGIPVLIHLLTRDRIRRVSFPSLRFLAGVSRDALRRKRLRELLLIAMRALVCALLAVTFARPMLRPRAPEDSGQGFGIARCILVDLSASMRRSAIRDALRQEVIAAIDDLDKASDAAALIGFADAPALEVPLTRDAGALREAAARIEPGYGASDLARAVRHAEALLRRVSARTKQVVLITDLQRSGLRTTEDWKLPAEVDLLVRAVGPEEPPPNVAIVEASCPSTVAAGQRHRIVAVRLANFSPEERRDVTVTLTVDGSDVASQVVHMPPNAQLPVRFRHVFGRPGDVGGAVTVHAEDAMLWDNTFYFVVRVVPRVEVLIIAGHGLPVPVGSSAFYLRLALSPDARSPFRVRTVAAREAAPEDVGAARVVVLADVSAVSQALAARLTELVSNGGGLFFLPGGATEAGAFNQSFAALAPCRLRRPFTPRARAGAQPETMLTEIDYDHPIFQPFHGPHHGDLATPTFSRYWEVTDSQLSAVLARFGDGRPAMLERAVGNGLSIMLVAPPDMRWTSLPLRAVFPPLVHQTVRRLAARTEAPVFYRVGDRLPTTAALRLLAPDGEALDPAEPVARQPGLHAAVDADGSQVRLDAVNPRPGESDPATTDLDELVAALTPAKGAPAGDTVERSGAGNGVSVWPYVLLAVCALTTGELALANHSIRH